MNADLIDGKVLIWFGPNARLKNGWSSKVYIVAVQGRTLVRQFGAANRSNQRVEMRWLQKAPLKTYSSHQEAQRALVAVVNRKLSRGYERAPRGMAIKLVKPKAPR
jgi:predicted DNA-binding WGR domain protein